MFESMSGQWANLPHIAVLHNRYQNYGGEDSEVQSEVDLLTQRGHPITLLFDHNDRIQDFSSFEKLRLLLDTSWNRRAMRDVKERLRQAKAEILHVHNFFPLWSPSVHAGARALGIPTVQHLHNFRLGCLNGLLYRRSARCEDCVGRNPWRGVWRRCYRGSSVGSLAAWGMISVNRRRKTWSRDVDAFVAPSRFAAEKLIEIGLPEEKMHIKPNLTSGCFGQTGVEALPETPRFAYVGRLSEEKGVLVLLRAWAAMERKDWRLEIIGEGEQWGALDRFVAESGLENVRFHGRMAKPEVAALMARVSCVICPSQCYETFGLAALEAFACGRAVVASRLGALCELVTDGETGFLVDQGDVSALAERLCWLGDRPSELARMGGNARQLYLRRFSAEVIYETTASLYRQLLSDCVSDRR